MVPIRTTGVVGLILLIVLVGCALFAHGRIEKCPFQCKCSAAGVICSCHRQNTLLLTAMPPNRLKLTISDCEEVQFHQNPFSELSLDLVVVQNSRYVNVKDITFLGVRGIRRLKFANIANLTLSSLYSLKADYFELSNVTIDSLDKSVIPGVAEFKEVRIVDSRIGVITKGALHFEHDQSVDIMDTTIGYVDTEAVCIDQVSSFTLRNCRIMELAEDAMHLLNVGKVIVSGNSIHTINDGSFLADGIQEMSITENDFRRVATKSFFHTQNVARFTMSSNRFLHVDRHGILLHLQVEEPSVIIENNEFFCDCDLFWLYQEYGYHKYAKFLNSTCHGPDKLAGLTLSSVTPLVSSQDECLRLESIDDRSTAVGNEGVLQTVIQMDDYELYEDSSASATGLSSLTHAILAAATPLLFLLILQK